MTIRYSCETCGSTLKIKDDLAGKPGKCPKCKTAFTIPDPEADASLADEDETESSDSEDNDQPSALSSAPLQEDFDVDAFLSSDSPSTTGKKSKVKAPRSVPSDTNEAISLGEDLDDKPKSKKSKTAARSADADDDEVFQIRRNEQNDSGSKKYALPPGLDEDSENRLTPSRRPPGMSAGGNASNIAQDLLSKSGKKGKKAAWTDPDPNADKEPGYDWAELGRFIGIKIAPAVVGGVVLIWLLYALVFSAIGGKSHLPDLGRVTGKVTLNGKPLAGVEISFVPLRSNEEKADKTKDASASFAATEADGSYELIYVKTADAVVKGAAIGQCRVEIQAMGRSDIPAKYVGRKSELKFEVKPGRQIIDIELK